LYVLSHRFCFVVVSVGEAEMFQLSFR
jgi:hypothetical protein